MIGIICGDDEMEFRWVSCIYKVIWLVVEEGVLGGEGTSTITFISDNCPSDTLKWSYELWLGLLCGVNDKQLFMSPSYSLIGD